MAGCLRYLLRMVLRVDECNTYVFFIDFLFVIVVRLVAVHVSIFALR